MAFGYFGLCVVFAISGISYLAAFAIKEDKLLVFLHIAADVYPHEAVRGVGTYGDGFLELTLALSLTIVSDANDALLPRLYGFLCIFRHRAST